LAFDRFTADECTDLYTHHLLTDTRSAFSYRKNFEFVRSEAARYTRATGIECRLVGYEGGVQASMPTTTPGIGKVAVTNGSADVRGTGTKFTTYFRPGKRIRLYRADGSFDTIAVASIASDTALTLTSPYPGPTATGCDYRLAHDFSREKQRDMVYGPGWYVAERDFFGLLQRSGFYRMSTFTYAGPWFMGVHLWPISHAPNQRPGRGDGSDGGPDNRLFRAVPTDPGYKGAGVNQDDRCCSVRQYAMRAWNREVFGPDRKPPVRRPRMPGRSRK
jgi:hypothetical protein